MNKKILMIGQFPPPYNGCSIAMDALWKSEIIKKYYKLIKIDTKRPELSSDSEIGRISLEKILIDIRSFLKLMVNLILKRPVLTYLSLAQTKLGLLRDSIYILLSYILRSRVIIHLHGGNYGNLYNSLPSWFKLWIKFVLKRTEVAIVLTASLKNMLEGIVKDERIRVIPNYVEDYLFLRDDEIDKKINKIREENKHINVLFLSNLLKSKGYLDVIKAILLLKDMKLSVRGLFAGNWPNQYEKLEASKFINAHGLQNDIEFLGFVQSIKKRKVLLESDVFVLPTYYYYEGLPISLLEAMAMGLIIITTKRGGIPDVIEEQKNGFFVPPGEPRLIAEVIKELYYKPDLRIEIMKNNIKKAAANFKKKHYEESILKIFNKILNHF